MKTDGLLHNEEAQLLAAAEGEEGERKKWRVNMGSE